MFYCTLKNLSGFSLSYKISLYRERKRETVLHLYTCTHTHTHTRSQPLLLYKTPKLPTWRRLCSSSMSVVCSRQLRVGCGGKKAGAGLGARARALPPQPGALAVSPPAFCSRVDAGSSLWLACGAGRAWCGGSSTAQCTGGKCRVLTWHGGMAGVEARWTA